MSGISRDDLLRLADGQLDGAERERLEVLIAADPEAAAELARLRRENDAIRTLFAPAGAEAVPARLAVRQLARRQTVARRQRWRWAVAAVLVLGLGIGVGWFGRPLLENEPPSEALIADAIRAHTVFVAENRHAVEVPGSDGEHLSTWLSHRLDTTLGLPDLAAEGFTLVGGRLLPGESRLGGSAAQLMYQDTAGERITVYVTAALPGGEQIYQVESYPAAEAVYWADARITCTVVGTLAADRMKTVAGAVYDQLKDAGTRA